MGKITIPFTEERHGKDYGSMFLGVTSYTYGIWEPLSLMDSSSVLTALGGPGKISSPGTPHESSYWMVVEEDGLYLYRKSRHWFRLAGCVWMIRGIAPSTGHFQDPHLGLERLCRIKLNDFVPRKVTLPKFSDIDNPITRFTLNGWAINPDRPNSVESFAFWFNTNPTFSSLNITAVSAYINSTNSSQIFLENSIGYSNMLIQDLVSEIRNKLQLGGGELPMAWRALLNAV